MTHFLIMFKADKEFWVDDGTEEFGPFKTRKAARSCMDDLIVKSNKED